MRGSPHVESTGGLRRGRLRAGVSTGLVFVFAAWSLAASEVGTQAPDFTIETPDGESVSLEALRGRVIFLNFWASWCVPCREELTELDRLQASYDRDDIVILAVNVDEHASDVERFLDGHPLNALTVLLDSRFEVVSRYDPAGMPASFLIDGGGTIRYAHIGYTPKVLAEYRRQIDTLIEKSVLVRVRYRFYTQTGADFYQPIYSTLQPLITLDDRLQPSHSNLLGGSVGFGLGGLTNSLSGLHMTVVYERYFGNASILGELTSGRVIRGSASDLKANTFRIEFSPSF